MNYINLANRDSNFTTDVKYSTKFGSEVEHLVERAQAGNINALVDLINKHYGDIVESIVSKYRYLANTPEEMEKLRTDGYAGIGIAIRRLSRDRVFDLDDLTDVLAHIIWYTYFFMVALRTSPNLYIEYAKEMENTETKFDLDRKLEIDVTTRKIFKLLRREEYSMAIDDKNNEVNPNRNIFCWDQILNCLNERFCVTPLREIPFEKKLH